MVRRRYYSLDIAKFAFTLMIAIFHFLDSYEQPASGGFVAVEFFFIVSGFLLMSQHDAQTSLITPAHFTWNRIKKYYPHYIFSFLMIFFASNMFVHGRGFLEITRNLINQFPEIFMLHGTIISDEHTFLYNSMTWYISILLIVEYILWALLNERKSMILTAAPIIVIWIYAYLAYSLGTTNNWRAHVLEIFNYASLRAIAGISFGILVYRAKKKISDHVKNNGGGYLGLGAIVLILVYFASYKWFDTESFVYTVCFGVGIVLMTAGEEHITYDKNNFWIRVVGQLSKISYAIYLNHYIVMFGMKYVLIHEYHLWAIPIYLSLLLGYSIFTTKLVNIIQTRAIKWVNQYWKK